MEFGYTFSPLKGAAGRDKARLDETKTEPLLLTYRGRRDPSVFKRPVKKPIHPACLSGAHLV